MSQEQFSYNTLPYPSFTFAQTHPNRLAVIGKFYGIETASPEQCRVLELGCGDGTNLNWLADSLPESEFVGVDLAETHINDANQNCAELRLKNVKFLQQDVMEMTVETFGKFDYIIAHGLFSWVPDFVREKVLNLYRNLLTVNGIGYVSYNTFPGCHRRQIVRDLMTFHTRKFDNQVQKVEQGVAFLNFMTEQTKSNAVHHEVLKTELEQLINRGSSAIFHDDLSDESQPFYFKDFVERAEKHDLQFVSEVDHFATQPRKISPEVAQIFEKISDNLVEYEQYVDFLENCQFRQTLICHKEISLDRKFAPAKIKQFFVSSNLSPVEEITNLASEKSEKFMTPKGSIAETNHVLTKTALFHLHTSGTHQISFAELIEKAAEILETEGFTLNELEKESDITATLFFQLHAPDSVRFHVHQSRGLNYISEQPKLSDFARWQATKNQSVTTFHGLVLPLDNEFIRELFNLVDGTRTRANLIGELAGKFQSDEQTVDEAEFIEQVSMRLEQSLIQMMRVGLLI